MSVGSVRVMFATDYKIDLLEITISDFTELIPRPKDDASESPVIDPKTDSKKKNASKKGSAAAIKGSNYSVPESVVNEFGVTHKTMRTLGVSPYLFSCLVELNLMEQVETFSMTLKY